MKKIMTAFLALTLCVLPFFAANAADDPVNEESASVGDGFSATVLKAASKSSSRASPSAAFRPLSDFFGMSFSA